MIERVGVRRGLLVLACSVSCIIGLALVWVFAPGLFAELSTPALLAVVGLMTLPLLLSLVCRRERSALESLAAEPDARPAARVQPVAVEQIRADAETVVQRERRRSVIHEPAVIEPASHEPV